MKKLIKKKSDIRKLLQNGSNIKTTATAMLNGGTHSYWMENDQVMCYGSGPGWHDQKEYSIGDIEQAVDHLWLQRKDINKHIRLENQNPDW